MQQMKASRAWYLLLLLPFIGTLLPFLYNRASPSLFGLPFFYWYQLAWVVVTSLLLGIIAFVFRRRDV
jgi:hypothetical protein